MPRSVAINEKGRILLKELIAQEKDDDGKKLSQLKIATQIYITDRTLRDSLKGKAIDFSTVVNIAKRFGLKVEDIIDSEEIHPNDEINWREVCQKMLQKQQHQQRLRRQITELKHEIEIFVPLGLIQPKPARRKEETPFPDAAEGMRQYELKTEEITKQYEYKQFIDEVIIGQQSKNLAIIGEPGAGKTTWLSKIAEYLADNPDNPSPICISLSRLENRTLKDYLLHIWLQEALNYIPSAVTVADFQQQFKDKRVWLLLDGVDEMKTTANSPLSQLNSQLEGWLNWTRVILTCRLNVWQPNRIANFEYYRTLAFSDVQVRDFIQQWYEKAEKRELGEQLQQKLTVPQHSRIFDLVKNPLRLAMLCQSWYFLQGELPETKANLYQRFVDATYEWKQEEFGTTAAQRQQLNKALGKLALRMIDEQISLKESVIKDVMSLEEFELAERLGWLNWVYRDQKTDERVYAFFHLSFAEYFAACVIDDWDYFLPRHHVKKPVEVKKYRIFENEWNEIFLLWMGRGHINDKKEEFIKKLVNFKDGVNNFYSNLAYVQSGIALVEFKSCSLADKIIEQLIKWGFGYFDSKEKVWLNFIDPIPEDARKTLLLTDKERVIPALISLFHNIQSKDTRRKADLISLLHDIQSEDTRGKFAKSLGKIEAWDEQTISAVIPFLENIQDEFTRWSVAERLGKIDVGNEQAISALIPFLKDTRNEGIRWRVAEILGNIAVGNEQVIAALIKLLNDTQSEPTRRIVADSLGKIAVGNEQVIAALIKLLNDTQNEDIRSSVADILGKILKTEHNYLITVSALNKHLTNEVETNFDLYEKCFKILWQCTKHLTYPQFYQAWHATNTTTPKQLEQPYTDIYTQLKQLQPTSTTYHIPLNAANLEAKTTEKAIAKGILIKIYGEIFPKQKANTIEDIFDLENELQPLRKHLKTDKIALIFCRINPHPELINFCQQLQKDWLKIALITDTPIASPLSGFPPQQDNLLGVVQTWLEELG